MSIGAYNPSPLLVIPNSQPKNAFVPPGGFAAWQAALARADAGTGIAVAAGIGASIIGGGTVCTDILTKSYWALWALGVSASHSRQGDTFLPTYSAKWNSGVTQSTPVFVHDTTPSSWTPDGPFYCAEYTATGTAIGAGTTLFHYTHPSVALGYNAQSLRVFYWRQGNQDGGTNDASHTFQINTANQAAGATTVTLTATNDNFIGFVDFPNLPNTVNNSLYFGNQNAANAMKIIAVASYPSPLAGGASSGVHFSWFNANGSWCLGDLGDRSGQYPSNKIARLIGTLSGVSPFVPSATLTPPFAPDLAFIDIFDDARQPASIATSATTPTFTNKRLPSDAYGHVLADIIRALRRKSTGCNVAMMIPNFPTGMVSDTNPPADANVYHLENVWMYWREMKYHAEMNNQAWLNTDAEWGELGGTLGFLTPSGTDPHPRDAGHADIKGRIGSRLGV